MVLEGKKHMQVWKDAKGTAEKNGRKIMVQNKLKDVTILGRALQITWAYEWRMDSNTLSVHT